jgi:hypothetical protein
MIISFSSKHFKINPKSKSLILQKYYHAPAEIYCPF